MKKLFTMLAVCLCGTMAYAQSGAISVKDVTIAKGGSTQMEVTVNNAASNTAFQFDLKLPAGVSVKSATMNDGAVESNAEGTQSRKLLHKLYTESDNVYRFLSYDNANAALTNGKVSITLEAAEDAETAADAAIASSDVLVVAEKDGEITTTTQDDNNDIASITVADVVNITISDKSTAKVTTYVGDVDLDFTNNENLTAYIVTGIDETGLWLARITQVPAGTPIYVKGKATGTFSVNQTKLPKGYFKSFLVGNNTDAKITVNPEAGKKYYNCTISGWSPFDAEKEIGAHKAYICADALPAAKAGADVSVTIKEGNDRTSLCADVDLDFTDQTDLTAYTVMGYDGGIWISPVKRVSAGTPLYLKGPAKAYTVKSSEVQTVYANMLVGNTTGETIVINSTDGDYTNLFVGGSGFSTFTGTKNVSKNKSYLQILTSYYNAPATTRGNNEGVILGEKVVEMAKCVIGGEDVGATGISRVATEGGNDTWYNLSGQRISTPTTKGLYIKNGKKVIVK